ncbi:hypothetical protein KC354_g22 [Hortaea werneckii]|nr:hypothetical protein KC354_g22 [Hortaea werneckii]
MQPIVAASIPFIPVAPSSHDHISADSGSRRLHMHLQHLNLNPVLLLLGSPIPRAHSEPVDPTAVRPKSLLIPYITCPRCSKGPTASDRLRRLVRVAASHYSKSRQITARDLKRPIEPENNTGTVNCRSMQHVPSGVFQKLQQQREGEARQEGREPGSDDARGSRGYKRPLAPSSSPRHSTASRRPHHYDDRRHNERHRDEDYELSPAPSSRYRQERGRYTNDRDLDRERHHRHHGNPPPRRYHHSS